MLLLVGSILIACGTEGEPTTNDHTNKEGATEQVTLKFGHYFSEQDSVGRSAEHWANLVEEKSEGNITVEVYPNEQLVSGSNGLQATGEGTIDLYTIVPSYISGQIPIFDFFGLPVLDPEYTYEKMYDITEEASPILDEHLAQENVQNLGVIHTTGRSELFSNVPIKSIDDLDGLKLRGIGGMLDEVVQDAGASTVFLSASELYLALQTGTIDGMTTSYTSYVADSLYEVAPYWLRVGLVQYPMFLFMNADKWNSLTSEQQSILNEATEESLSWLREHQMEEEEELLKVMKENAEEIYTLDDEEWELWYEMAKPTHEKFISDHGEDAEKLMEIMDKHMDK